MSEIQLSKIHLVNTPLFTTLVNNYLTSVWSYFYFILLFFLI